MYLERLSNNNKLPNLTVDTSITSQNQTTQTELNQPNPVISELDSAVSLFLLWITIFSIVILALVKILNKLERSKMQSLSILPHSQIPCRQCIFFNQNEYLKCAVNPQAVFTKQAIACLDYHNRNEDCAANDASSQVKAMVNRDEPKNYS